MHILDQVKQAMEQGFIYDKDIGLKYLIDGYNISKHNAIVPEQITFYRNSSTVLHCYNFLLKPPTKEYTLDEVLAKFWGLKIDINYLVYTKSRHEDIQKRNELIAENMGYKKLDNGNWVKE